MAEATHLRLKCRYDGEIRTVIVNVDKVDFSELRRRLSSDFGFEVSLKYEDMDGDHITLSSQNDFEGLVHGRYVNETVNVFVTQCKPLPTLKHPGAITRESSINTLTNMSRESSMTSLTGEGSLSPPKQKKTLTIETTPGADDISSYQDDDKYNANSVESSASALSNLRSPGSMSSSFIGSSSPMSPLSTRDRSLVRVGSFNSSTFGRYSGAHDGPPGTSGGMSSDFPGMNRDRSGSQTSMASSGGDPSENQIRWKKGEMLGQGAFGVVYLGLNQDSGELMAVKQLSREEVSGKEINSLENEIKLLQSLWHPNIVRYMGTEINNSTLSIFLEYVPGGSLKALIDKFGALEESVSQTYTRQLLLGLEYLHNNGIAHRDIKGGNCLVGNDGVIKLADFGNSKHWRAKAGTSGMKPGGSPDNHSTGTSNDIKGTPSWMAPEVIREQGSGSISWRKADVWSLACTTLEMASGRAPWSQFSNSVTILYHIACQETLPEYPSGASMEMTSFLNMCLQREPSKRPDISSLLLHPFVAKMAANGWNTAAGAMGCVVRPSTVGQVGASSGHNGFEVRERDSKYGRDQRGRTSQSAVRQNGQEYSEGGEAPQECNSINTSKDSSSEYLEESESTELVSKNEDVPFLEDSGGVDGDCKRSLVTTLNPDMGMDVPPGLEGLYDDSGEADNEGDVLEKSDDALEVSDEVETPRVLAKSAIISARSGGMVVNGGSGKQPVAVSISIGDSTNTKKKLDVADGLEESGGSSDSLMSSENNLIDPEVSHPRPKHMPAQAPIAAATPADPDSGSNDPSHMATIPAQLSVDVEKEGDDHPPLSPSVTSPFPSMPDFSTQIISGESSSDMEGLSPRARSDPPPQQTHPLKPVLPLSSSVKDKKLSPSARRAVARRATRAMSEVELDPLTEEEQQRIAQQRLQRQAAAERLKGLQSNNRIMQASPVNILPLHPVSSPGRDVLLGMGPQKRIGTASQSPDGRRVLDMSRVDSEDSLDGQSETSLSGTGLYDGDSLSSVSQGGEPPFVLRGDKALPVNLDEDSTDADEPKEPKWHVPNDHHLKFASSPIRPSAKIASIGSLQASSPSTIASADGSPSLEGPQLIRSTSKIDSTLAEKTVRFASSSRMVNNPGLKVVIPDSMPQEEGRDDESKDSDSPLEKGEAKSYVVGANHVPTMTGSMKVATGGGPQRHQWNEQTAMAAGGGEMERAVYQPRTNRQLKEMPIPQSPIRSLSKSMSTSVIGSPKRLGAEMNGEKVFSRSPTRGPPRVRKQNHPASAHPRMGRGILRDDGRDLFHGTGFEYPGDNRPDPIQTLEEMTAQAVKPGFASAPEASRRSATKSSQGMKKRLNSGHRLNTAEEGRPDFLQQGSSSPITFDSRKKLLQVSSRGSDINSPSLGGLESANSGMGGMEQEEEDGDEEETDFFDDDEGEDMTGPQKLLEHTEPVSRLRAPRRTELLLSSSVDGTVKIWGPERRSKATLDATEFVLPGFSSTSADKSNDSAHRTSVMNVWAEENCDTIWGACSDYALRVWDGTSGQGLRFLKGHAHAITAMEGLDRVGKNQGRALVGTGSADKTVRVWDARAKKGQVFLFKGHSDAVTTLRWGEGGRSLVTGSKDKTIRIWDTRAGRQRALCERHFDAINALRAIPEFIKCSTIDGEAGASFVSGGRDSSMNLWTADGDCVGSQTSKNRSSITMLSDINANLAFRSGVPFLFSLSSDNIVRLFDLRRFKFATEFSVPGPSLVKAVWAGQSIFTTSSSGDIRRWFPSATTHLAQSEQGGATTAKDDITWQSQQLLSHTAGATDLISTEKFVASSSRSGEIIRFWGS